MRASAQGQLRGTKVVVRSGNGLRKESLQLVSAAAARSIIILADDSCETADESDARQLRITLSLCGLPNFMKRDVHIVAELGDPTNLELLQLVGTHQRQSTWKPLFLVTRRVTVSSKS